ncbi:MerR family transcriptional regulator [Microbacterium aurantiacum]|uniref:helix-turn-helix domain-containing protein n=1 Tax=Microbacterium aurantiacum TaxID=162393 RepID=UPI003D761698
MAWSTRELADLAGTTVNTVRHYHRLGLLAEPDRRYNGYKQYRTEHLVALLRIRRLVDLGVPLAQVGDVGTDRLTATEALREVDAELEAKIERLQEARSAIATILRAEAPADTPAGFEVAGSRLSSADSSMIHLYSRLYDEESLVDLREIVTHDEDPVGAEIDRLPADADEQTRRELAERLAPSLAQNLRDYPWLRDPGDRLTRGEEATRDTVVEAMHAVYNPAQLEVLARASILAHAMVADD